MTAIRPEVSVLFFDVFGTTVAQLPPLAEALSRTAAEALRLDIRKSGFLGRHLRGLYRRGRHSRSP